MEEPTPKPWVMVKSETSEFYQDEWYIDRAGQDIGAVAIVNGEANARRIVLAPEMLEALEEISNYGHEYYCQGACPKEIADAALAKAKGEAA